MRSCFWARCSGAEGLHAITPLAPSKVRARRKFAVRMPKPVIGLTCQLFPEPLARSSVNQQYVDAVAAAGGAPMLLPIGLDREALDRLFGLADGVLLPGGDDVSPSLYGEV